MTTTIQPDELLHDLQHQDPNHLIATIRAVGVLLPGWAPAIRRRMAEALVPLLTDHRTDEYSYCGFQADEEEPQVCVSEEAARVLRALD